MSKRIESITPEQFMLLQGFMLYIWNVKHGDESSEYFSFWADQMDEAKIGWYTQNMAAYVMEKRENGWKYFRTLLKEQGIIVEEPKPFVPKDLITAEYDEDNLDSEKPFVVNLIQCGEKYDVERYPTETSAMERAEDINRMQVTERVFIN